MERAPRLAVVVYKTASWRDNKSVARTHSTWECASKQQLVQLSVAGLRRRPSPQQQVNDRCVCVCVQPVCFWRARSARVCAGRVRLRSAARGRPHTHATCADEKWRARPPPPPNKWETASGRVAHVIGSASGRGAVQGARLGGQLLRARPRAASKLSHQFSGLPLCLLQWRKKCAATWAYFSNSHATAAPARHLPERSRRCKAGGEEREEERRRRSLLHGRQAAPGAT